MGDIDELCSNAAEASLRGEAVCLSTDEFNLLISEGLIEEVDEHGDSPEISGADFYYVVTDKGWQIAREYREKHK